VQTTGFKDVEDWRAVLGAEDPTYDQFKDFNKKVLKPAIQGVNSKSGIIVDPEFEREKRRVARIKFNVREDPQLSLLEYREHSKIRETEAYKAVRDIGLQDVVAIHFIETKGEAAVLEAVAYVQDKKPKNPTGYLVHALKSGYGVKTTEERKKAVQGQQRALEDRDARKAEADAVAAQKALEGRFKAHQKDRVREILAKLSSEDRETVREMVSGDIPIPSVAQQWDAIGRDPDRVDELKRGARGIMLNRLTETVLGRWGTVEDRDIQAFSRMS
jgi:hypothetical protein